MFAKEKEMEKKTEKNSCRKSTCPIYELCSQRAHGTNGVSGCQNAGRKPHETEVITEQTGGIVDNVITTQFNFPLQPGMKVQISKEKGKKEFHNRLLKIVYEDAYIIVVEKMQGLLSVNTERQKERTAYTILNEYVQRSGRQHRVFIVHRLDRDTSGLMMFAKTKNTTDIT